MAIFIGTEIVLVSRHSSSLNTAKVVIPVRGEAMEKTKGKSTTKKSSNCRITLDQFIFIMAPLVDMEKEAEISVSMNSGGRGVWKLLQEVHYSELECTDAQIEAQSSVSAHTLHDLVDVKRSTLLLIDTSVVIWKKKDEEDSTLNEGEAAVAISHAMRLVDYGVQAVNIGITTPYGAQVVSLKMLKGNENKLKDMEINKQLPVFIYLEN